MSVIINYMDLKYANETNRSSRSEIATNTASHLSMSSELSELDWPFCSNNLIDHKVKSYKFNLDNNWPNSIIVSLTWSLPTRRLSHPICFSSPIIFDKARFASIRARCVLRAMAEWSALNHAKASGASVALKIHECTPSGEWSSMQRFSLNRI